MKSEPETFGIADLATYPDKTDHWDGIRNYQARNFMRDDMQPGDLAFFYHSNCKTPGIVGIMHITSNAYPDHTALDRAERYYDPKVNEAKNPWCMVDVQLVRELKRPVSLDEMRHQKELLEMPLLRRGNRLSIMPITKKQWECIIKIEQT